MKPWIGSRVGVGGVALDGKAAPVLALQVTDPAKAKAGFAALAKCSDAGDEFGFTTTDDYVIASDSTAHAQAIADAGTTSTLAENADFQKWTDEVGGPGVMNAYLGRRSVEFLSKSMGPGFAGLGGSVNGSLGGSASSGPRTETLSDAFKDFKGAAAGLRFADGGIELAFAGGGTGASSGTRAVGRHVAALPKDTAALVALSVPAQALDRLTSGGPTGNSLFSLDSLITSSTGLDVPDDLVTLLGDSLSLSVGGDAPADLKNVSGPADLPLGLLVHGDEAKIRAVIEKVEAHTGTRLSDLSANVDSADGRVAVATSRAYADDLLGQGSLADSKSFQDVVSHAHEAQALFYLSLDNGWGDALRDLAADGGDRSAQEVADNLAVVRAVGGSTWTEGSTSHGLLRVALK